MLYPLPHARTRLLGCALLALALAPAAARGANVDLVARASFTRVAASPSEATIVRAYVVNAGPETATQPELVLSLPTGTAIDADGLRVARQRAVIDGARPRVARHCNERFDRLVCRLPALTPGQSVVVLAPIRFDPGTTPDGAVTAAFADRLARELDSRDNGASKQLVAPWTRLSATLTSPAPVTSPGGLVNLAAAVVDEGTVDASGVTIAVALPPALTPVAIVPVPLTQTSCQLAQAAVSCRFPRLAGGQRAAILLTAAVAADAEPLTALDVRMTARAANASTVSARTPLAASAPGGGAPADIVASAEPATDLTIGQPGTIRLRVASRGPATAVRARALVALPPSLAPTAATASRGSCAIVGANAVCSFGDLAPGADATIDVTVVPERAERAAIAAFAESDNPDASPENNATTTVRRPQIVRASVAVVVSSPVIRPRGGAIVLRTAPGGPEALVHVRVCLTLTPSLIAIAAPRGRLDIGRACYEQALVDAAHPLVARLLVRPAQPGRRQRVRLRYSVRARNADAARGITEIALR